MPSSQALSEHQRHRRHGRIAEIAEVGEDENKHCDKCQQRSALVAAAHHARDRPGLHGRAGNVRVDRLERGDEAPKRRIAPHVAARVHLYQILAGAADEPLAEDLRQVRLSDFGGGECELEFSELRPETAGHATLVPCERRGFGAQPADRIRDHRGGMRNRARRVAGAGELEVKRLRNHNL